MNIKIYIDELKLSVDVMVNKEYDTVSYVPYQFYICDCPPEVFRDTATEIPLPNGANKIYIEDAMILNKILNKSAIKYVEELEKQKVYSQSPF